MCGPTMVPGRLSRPLAAALISAGLLVPGQPAVAQFTQFGSKLVGTGAVGLAGQGSSVALSANGTTALVGGPGDNSDLGAGWVFTRGPFWNQQGGKLVGGNNVGAALEGTSVALSADGNTAIVGGSSDNNHAGAAWIFTRSGGVWSQQGGKLIGTDAAGNALQGCSVSLSGDGNTAIIGGLGDNNIAGAAWVFVRSTGAWSQQAKLVGTGAVGDAEQGLSVSLSGDGNTAVVGGPADDNTGAAWVFVRSGGAWSQQAKLVGTGAVGTAEQGFSVALSGDGNTAIVGAPTDNNGGGAAWIFTRSGAVWNQQGGKLVGGNNVGAAQQGFSVALSGDGNTAIVGGNADNGSSGAAWVFTRSGGAWSQLGGKLIGSGAVGHAEQGFSVALSGDGNIAVVGGKTDNGDAGAAWVFYAANFNPTASHDFNGDSKSDIAWRQSGGTAAAWLMNGNHVLATGSFGVVPTSWQIVGQRDFNNDRKYDWLWRDGASGTVAIWLLNGLSVLQTGTLGAVPANWVIAGTSDFNFDGKGDILWRDTTSGTVEIWLMDGLSILQTGTLGAVPLNWTIAATDGAGNIFWRDGTTGTVVIWGVYGFEVLQTANLGAVPLSWTIAGTGDFDGNSSTDILWRDSNSGTVAIWLMNGFSIKQTGTLGAVASNWSIAATGDFTGAGSNDILWRDNTSGTVAIWFMSGLQVQSFASAGAVTTDWTIQGLNAD